MSCAHHTQIQTHSPPSSSYTPISSSPPPSNQSNMVCQEEQTLITKITDLYTKISTLPSLKPSKEVNNLFTQLVHTCIPPPPPSFNISNLSKHHQETRTNLIKLCGEAESHLESHFSSLLSSTYQNPIHHLNHFPYYTNYLKLTHLEHSILSQHLNTQHPNKIAFVGSGPLPLTSIVLATNYLTKTCVHNFDIDPLANSKAEALVANDGDLAKRMVFHTCDVLSVTSELQEFEVVFLAALVGMDKETKVKVIEHLGKYMSPGALLMVRSAHGARAFLYPVVDGSDLKGFEILSTFHPSDEVINSVVLARKYSNSNLVHQQHMILPSKCSEIQGFSPLLHGNIIEELAVEDQMS